MIQVNHQSARPAIPVSPAESLSPCVLRSQHIYAQDLGDARPLRRFLPSSAGVFFLVDLFTLVKGLGETVEERLEAGRKAMIDAGVFLVRHLFCD